MKLPFFDFNDSYPLTLGVSDDYFALSTRLARLGRAPMQPRRRAAWLLGAALLVSFAAVVPFRLTARAQNERNVAQLSGIVKDRNGAAVANATVYLALLNRAEPLETTNTDAEGRFYFTSEIGTNRVVVWSDAGARGLGLAYPSQGKSGVRLANPIVAPRVPVKLLLVAPDGTRAANVRLSVGQMGPEADEQWIVPPAISQKLQTQTNARGEAVFAGLPQGFIAQFWSSDQKYYQSEVGFGDLRGGQYAPLSSENAVKVGKAKSWKTIRLLAPVMLRGRVTTPAGVGKSAALVLARRIGADTENSFGTEIIAQARAGANGAYAMDGLRPGFYRIEVAAEDWLAESYASPVEGRELKSPMNRVDLPLSRGGLIRGVVRQKGSKAPFVGQEISMLDGQREYQQTVTDERGAFQFRANTGPALVWVQQSGIKWPSSVFDNQWGFIKTEMKIYGDTAGRGFHLDSLTTFQKMTMTRWMPNAPGRNYKSRSFVEINAPNAAFVPVKADTTRNITLETTFKSLVKTATLTGTVSLPNGQGADAIIMVQPAVAFDYSSAIQKPTDARGRYSITGLKPGRYTIIAELDDATKANWAAPKITQTVKAGANRADIKLSRGALIEGTVISKASKKPLEGIEVLTADEAGDGTIVKTDALGKFRFRVAPGRVAVRLHQHPADVTIHVYDRGATPRSFVLSQNAPFMFNLKDGDTRRMQFESPKTSSDPANVATTTGTITGTARDERGRPLAGVRVWTYTQLQNRGIGSAYFTTAKDGKYRFDDFPAGGKVMIIARRKGYGVLPAPNGDAWGRDFRPLAKGQKLTLNVTLRVAPATLAGTVLKADGTPGSTYFVSPQNIMRMSATTKANGKFWMPEVFSGPRTLYVYDRMSRKRWGPYRAANNQRDLVLRLSEKMRDKNYELGQN